MNTSVERYLNIRQERKLPGDISAEAFTHPDGTPIDPGGLELLLHRASSTRLSMEFNTAFCSGLLKTRYGEDQQGLKNADLEFTPSQLFLIIICPMAPPNVFPGPRRTSLSGQNSFMVTIIADEKSYALVT